MKASDAHRESIRGRLEDIRRQRRRVQFEQLKSLRRQYAEELSVVRNALNSSLSGVIITDLDGDIRYVNDRFLRIFDYSNRAEVFGKNAADLFAMESIRKFADVKGIIDRASGDVVEFMMLRKDGSAIPVAVSASSVADGNGKIVGRMASFYDISQRRRVEAEKRQLEQQLEKSRRPDGAAHAIPRIGRELREALIVISGHLDRLQAGEPDSAYWKRSSREIRWEMERMGRLLQQLFGAVQKGDVRHRRPSALNRPAKSGRPPFRAFRRPAGSCTPFKPQRFGF